MKEPQSQRALILGVFVAISALPDNESTSVLSDMGIAIGAGCVMLATIAAMIRTTWGRWLFHDFPASPPADVLYVLFVAASVALAKLAVGSDDALSGNRGSCFS
jgi:hypothetical protein